MVAVRVHLGGAPGPAVPGLCAGGEGLTIGDEGELTLGPRLGGAVHTRHRGGSAAGRGRTRGCAAAWERKNMKVWILIIYSNVKEIE